MSESPATRLRPGEDGVHFTFCRLCEAHCGLAAKVEGGRITDVQPDKENPHSQGHVCLKGITFHNVTYDPDRVLTPMKRIGGPGEFAPVGWDEALDDIAARLGAVIDMHGPDAVASYKGNPIAFGIDVSFSLKAFLGTLGITKYYGAGSQDTNARLTACYLAFGSAVTYEIPDLPHNDMLLMFGANPLVSNGSMVWSPRVRHDLDAIAERGRVVVVDPRRTETARRYQHVAVRANGDVWLLLGLLRVLIDEKLYDAAYVDAHSNGFADLAGAVTQYALADCAERAGVDADTIAELARSFAATPRAVAYGRLGVCRGPHATLENFLLIALNLLGGKLGRKGGAIFSRTILGGSQKVLTGGYGDTRSRVGDFPSVAQFLASAMLPADILEPGEGQVRAMILTGGNMVMSAPGGQALVDALQQLDLIVALDLYQTESNRFADYILPVPTFFERDDYPMAGLGSMIRPFVQVTDAVIPPVGEARSEWEIFNAILTRMGKPTHCRPMDDLDKAFRLGPAGDQMGTREGWSFDALREIPHGVMVDLPDPYDPWPRIAWPDGRALLWHEMIAGEFARLTPAPSDRLRLITHRDIRSLNSWLHNVPRLVRSQHPDLLMHPGDAARLDLADGEAVELSTGTATVTVRIAITEDMRPGTVSYPHGWGHHGGWRHANAQGGSNINWLLPVGEQAVEAISGTTIMDGLEVSIRKLAAIAETTAA
ncbi:molybdopterin-dependent oxidoreductase [Sphingopyxis sp.]|uniref:molybdopterin-containing oxidoreductase family protein n=1 Tax=Sphingopyxis sp. TaxID=1908224 RepID=UPI001484ECB7|nr:molybdopterin-dependent oxidoreductase [Sphingopyxis sp.]MBR2171108.1 molybdopterin-dependent oxidoreductase [Sphingopyxis sp.]